jgi:hypothetical protein
MFLRDYVGVFDLYVAKHGLPSLFSVLHNFISSIEMSYTFSLFRI